MKKSSYLIVFFGILFLCFLVLVISSSKMKKSDLSVEQRIEQYQEIVNLVTNNTISVKSNGCITLPEEYKHLSDSGECFIVNFKGKTAIYFYTFRGILDSSKGYLFVTNELNYSDYSNTDTDFTNIVEIKENLYSCSTG